MKSESYWLQSGTRVSRRSLTEDLATEVVVIGGGITGITAAVLLRKAGKDVILLERDSIGQGETGHTTGHLTYMTDTRLSDLVSKFGEDHALASWDAGAAAMEQIEALAVEAAAECELRKMPGYLVLSKNAKDEAKEIELLEKEAHWAINHGFDVEHLDEIGPTGRPGIRFQDQLKFHPIKYLKALARHAREVGVRIYEETNVDEFLEKPQRLKVGDHFITYGQAVIATHQPLQGLMGTASSMLLQTKLYGYSTYAIQAVAPTGTLADLIWSDTSDPFYYLRSDQKEDRDVLIFGGQDHRTGQDEETEKRYHDLVEELSAMLPISSVERRWSGQVIETADGLPYIGWATEGQFIGTGFSGNGLTFGTLAGMMARDAIMGIKNPWADLFSPHRKKLSALWDYVKENADYPYYLAKDFAKGAEGKSTRQVKRNEGKILKLNGKRVATYRGGDGKVTKLSPVCPHLGCTVHFNEAEQTWDCPCHGSRFTAEGKLMTGPAETDLKPISE